MEEKIEVRPTSKGRPWASSICPRDVPPAAEAVAVEAAAAINASRRLNPVKDGAAAAINASKRLHPFENDGGGGGGRNRFSAHYSSAFVANCRPEGMNVAPAVSTPMMLDSAAGVMSVLTVDLPSYDLDSDVGSDRREQSGFAIGSGDGTPHGFDVLERSPKRLKLGVEEGKEALVGRDDKASMGIRWQGISAGGRDVTGGSLKYVGVSFDGGATYSTTAASAVAEAVDPATAPFGKKRKKRGVVGGRKGAMTEKLQCLDDEIDIGESAKVRGSEIFLFKIVVFGSLFSRWHRLTSGVTSHGSWNGQK